MTVFTVPMRPISKARPRFGNGHAYTPRRTKEYENMIASWYNRTRGIMHEGAITLEIRFCFQCPKSWNKAQRENPSEVPHMSKPDIDNLVKAVLDALNGVAWHDDKQITSITAIKQYATTDCIQVIINK